MRRQALLVNGVAAFLGLVGWVHSIDELQIDAPGLSAADEHRSRLPPGASLPPNLAWNGSMLLAGLGMPESGEFLVHALQFAIANLGDAPVSVSGAMQGLNDATAEVFAVDRGRPGNRSVVIDPGDSALFVAPTVPFGERGLGAYEFLRRFGSVRFELRIDGSNAGVGIPARTIAATYQETKADLLRPVPGSRRRTALRKDAKGSHFITLPRGGGNGFIKFKAPKGTLSSETPSYRVRSWVDVAPPTTSMVVS